MSIVRFARWWYLDSNQFMAESLFLFLPDAGVIGRKVGRAFGKCIADFVWRGRIKKWPSYIGNLLEIAM